MAIVVGVQMAGFFPKPMKKLKNMARTIWKVAMIAANWSTVLSVRHIFVEYIFVRNRVAIITVPQRAASAKKIISPLRAVGTIRLVCK